MAVGPTNLIATSPDGQNWTSNYTSSASLSGITYGAGQFVAVGGGGTVLTSPDGTTWTGHLQDPSWNLKSVCYGNSRYVAAAMLTIPTAPFWTAYVSTNGVVWTATSQLTVGTTDRLVFGNGLFAQNFFGVSNYLSSDGMNWWWKSAGSANSLYTLSFGNGVFIEEDVRNQVFTSSDATNWTFRGTNAVVRPTDFAFGNGYWVAVDGGSSQAYSADLATWTTIPQSIYGSRVIFGNGAFVAVGHQIQQSDPVLTLQSAAPGALLLSGPTNLTYEIQAVDNPNDIWQVITNLTPDLSPFLWNDPDSAKWPQRFYRVHLP